MIGNCDLRKEDQSSASPGLNEGFRTGSNRRRRNVWDVQSMSTYLGPDRYSPEQGDLVEQLASAVRDTGERIVADRDWEISLLV